MRKYNRLLPIVIIIAAFALLSSCAGTDLSLHGSPYDPPVPAPELPSQTDNGDHFKLSDIRGDVALVYFGYTYCPDVCPTTLADVKLVFEELDEVSDDLHLIMVTVDPERDTPDVLHTYLERFHPGFVGLRAEGEALKDVTSSYAVFAQKEPSDDPDRYLVSHTARLFLIDQDGRLRTNYPFATPREDIISDIRLLLEERN